MFHATVERGGVLYRLGVYNSQDEADVAKEVAGLCLDKFLEATRSPTAVRAASRHLGHPAVDSLLREPTLEAALAKLSSGDVVKQLTTSAPAGPAAPAVLPTAPSGNTERRNSAEHAQERLRPAETAELATTSVPEAIAPVAVPESPVADAGHQNGGAVPMEADRHANDGSPGAENPAAAPAAEPSPSKPTGGGMPPKWTEWPPGSGTFATVLTKQNFPARIAVQRSAAWIMGKIFGDDILEDIAAQGDALPSKAVGVTVALEDGTAVEGSLRQYHKTPGSPFYLSSITWFFKRHALAVGDVLLFKPSGRRRVTLQVIKCAEEEAKKVHAAVNLDLQAELAKMEGGDGVKRAAEGTPEQSPAKRVAMAAPAPKADLRGRLLDNPFGGIAKVSASAGPPAIRTPAAPLPPAARAAVPDPAPVAAVAAAFAAAIAASATAVAAAQAPVARAPASAPAAAPILGAPAPTSAPAAASNPTTASAPPWNPSTAGHQPSTDDLTAPAVLVAAATAALADPTVIVPQEQLSAMYAWYHCMAIARKARLAGYELKPLTHAAREAFAAKVAAELKAMTPRERDELVFKCYVQSYKSIIETKKSAQRQAVIDAAVATWREKKTEPSTPLVKSTGAPKPAEETAAAIESSPHVLESKTEQPQANPLSAPPPVLVKSRPVEQQKPAMTGNAPAPRPVPIPQQQQQAQKQAQQQGPQLSLMAQQAQQQAHVQQPQAPRRAPMPPRPVPPPPQRTPVPPPPPPPPPQQQQMPQWNGHKPPLIRSRPAAPTGKIPPIPPQQAAITQRSLTYVPPSHAQAAAAATQAAAQRPSTPFEATQTLQSAIQAAQQLRSALESAAVDRPSSSAAPAQPAPAAPAPAPPQLLARAKPAPAPVLGVPAAVQPSMPPPPAPTGTFIAAAEGGPAQPFMIVKQTGPTPLGSTYTPVEILDGEYMVSHLKTVEVLDRLAKASEALRDAVKDSFKMRKSSPHGHILLAVEAITAKLEDSAVAVREASKKGGEGGGNGVPK